MFGRVLHGAPAQALLRKAGVVGRNVASIKELPDLGERNRGGNGSCLASLEPTTPDPFQSLAKFGGSLGQCTIPAFALEPLPGLQSWPWRERRPAAARVPDGAGRGFPAETACDSEGSPF